MGKMERYEELVKRERELSKHIKDNEALLEAFEGGRTRLETNLGGLNMSAAEMKGQQRILKERQAWLIGQQDEIRAEQERLRKLIGKTTRPGDSR
jgi:hypothetical protein